MEFDIEENGQRGLTIDGIWYCEELIIPAIRNLEEDKRLLRSALAPLLAHALADDKAPPIKFSVQDCRKIKEALG